MIGQKNLCSRIDKIIENGMFPRFCILVGPRGSEKEKIAKYIADKLSLQYVSCGNSVNDIRQIIDFSYTSAAPILYTINDADAMSVIGKNALLKITEEPPNNTYFIITLLDENNTLPTVRSRSQVLYMDNYTPAEVLEYALMFRDLSEEEQNIVTSLCITPGEVDVLFAQYGGILEFYNYVEKVVNNIATVSGANAFKIAGRINFKDEPTKYDLQLFWRAFMVICSTRLKEDPFKYSRAIRITSQYLQELRFVSVNKAATFDMWLLYLRKDWLSRGSN